MWLLSIVPAVSFLVLLLVGIRRTSAGHLRSELIWWAQCLATFTFYLGCLLFLLEMWHLGREGVIHNELSNIRVALALRGQAPQIAAFIAVALAGNAVAMVLKGKNRRSFQQPPA